MVRKEKVKEDLVEENIPKVKKVKESPKQEIEPEIQVGEEKIVKPIEVEITPVAAVQGKIRWRNDGGTLRFRKNQIIKPGEKFTAYPDEIPKAFRDVIIALEPIIEGNMKQEIPANVTRVTYSLKPNDKEDGFFDIYNAKGKKMNEKPLEEEIAKQLIKDLQS
jgi:hypothetical protein